MAAVILEKSWLSVLTMMADEIPHAILGGKVASCDLKKG
jgi:hypothetical protein